VTRNVIESMCEDTQKVTVMNEAAYLLEPRPPIGLEWTVVEGKGRV